jgi:hypothetical protein
VPFFENSAFFFSGPVLEPGQRITAPAKSQCRRLGHVVAPCLCSRHLHSCREWASFFSAGWRSPSRLALTFVPAMCSLWLKSHHPKAATEIHGEDYHHRYEHENEPARSWLGKLFERWEAIIAAWIVADVR